MMLQIHTSHCRYHQIYIYSLIKKPTNANNSRKIEIVIGKQMEIKWENKFTKKFTRCRYGTVDQKG